MRLKNNDELYSRKILEEDLKYSYCGDDEGINNFIRDGYNAFIEKKDILIPSKELSESVLSELVLKELKIEDKKQLKFVDGSFLISKDIEFSTRESIFFGMNNSRPLGGVVVLRNLGVSRKKPKVRINLDKWYNMKLPYKGKGSGEYIYHRGCLIAFGFVNYIESKEVLSRMELHENVVTLSNWSNMGNHDGEKGINHSYIENNIIRILNENYNIEIYYEVKPIFEKDEVVPRGLHIQIEIHGEIKNCSGNLHTLNIFIPNVDARFKVRYKR